MDGRTLLRLAGSQRVKKRKAAENVKRRLVSGARFFGHLPQYGQMRCRFSVGRYLFQCLVYTYAPVIG
jgi:hypothetical protein